MNDPQLDGDTNRNTIINCKMTFPTAKEISQSRFVDLRIRTRNKREFQEAHEIETSNSHNEKRKRVRNMKQEVGAPVGGKKVIHMKSQKIRIHRSV